jgi:hypothetical protein
VGGPWKGESRRANNHGYVHRLDKVATSFFFTNFPDEVKAVDLWPRFAKFGRVGEVFIPAKVDKQGRRFGFVKFREVANEKELLRRISNIWIDSFKLRINLSKFSRQSVSGGREDKRKVDPVVSPRRYGGKAQAGKSFKAALVVEEKEDNRAGVVQNTMAEERKTNPKPEVVWEVEVEEERLSKLEGAYVGYLVEERDVQTIQNNFRMDGFHGLNVCTMGFMTVLIWSNKVEEVKEVVETVGWWCSLFEKVVPWSPELVSNKRVAWLRCFGVPPHAWGADLFRSLAFKFGRFIEVDESTKDFKRCDFARVRILTSVETTIDSSMAVSVLGKRFDIRVLEELGSNHMVVRNNTVRGEAWPEELSSRASGEGGSFQAVMEGFSETGSDADVSDSGQVLLGVQAHGMTGTATCGSLKVVEYIEGEMAGFSPNNLGKASGDSTTRVNLDGDIGGSNCSGSEDVVLRLEGGRVGGAGGVQDDDVSTPDSKKNVDSSVDRVSVESPAQHNISCPEAAHEGVEGCKEQSVMCIGPRVLRTRQGDICIPGPSILNKGVQLCESPVFSSEAHTSVKKKKLMSTKHTAKHSRAEGFEMRKAQYKKTTISDLPFNKVKKFSNLAKHRSNRRKKSDHRNNMTGSSSSSDSIHNSDIPPVSHLRSHHANFTEVAEGFTLEVVLPCLANEDGGPIPVATMPPGNQQNYGMEVLLRSDDVGGDRTMALEVPSRQVMEAKRIVEIQDAVGIKICENEAEHLDRIMEMESRDRAEKESWEMNRETEGPQ